MKKTFEKVIQGYQLFRQKYIIQDNSLMKSLAKKGQKPEIMVIACCDSRVDPAVILQCDPGDLFVVRNVANIVPPFEKDEKHHGTSAALEFGVCYLNIKHLIILGHSSCGGIDALLHQEKLHQNDFISNWVSILDPDMNTLANKDIDATAKQALKTSYQNCFTFPWIKEKFASNTLQIHLWFFDINHGEILAYSSEKHRFEKMSGLQEQA